MRDVGPRSYAAGAQRVHGGGMNITRSAFAAATDPVETDEELTHPFWD